MRYSILSLLFIFGACSDGVDPVRVSGSTTVLPAVSLASESYEGPVIVNAGGSGAGFNQMATGQVDLAMMSRDIHPDERGNFSDHAFTSHVVGRDVVVAVLSSELVDDGVSAIQMRDLEAIFDGRLLNWSQVGGPDREIFFVDKELGSGTRQTYMDAITGDAHYRAAGADLVVGPNNEEQTAIVQNDSALGFLSAAWTNADVVAVPVLDGNREMIFARDLVVVSREDMRDEARAFLDHLLGAQGQVAVQTSGYSLP
jgi:phosphate transport system substrate-binding protein